MASINYEAREVSVKIVYYGPQSGGKIENLQIIHRKLPPDHRSDLVSLATETDRTLFFDFIPVELGTIKGFATKFQLYTVPGQVYYNATRKLVLRGVDGVVFVADSAPDKIAENLESFQNLEDNLAEYHYNRDDIAIIIQYNKRDLPNALPIDELQRQVNKYNLPWTEAVASKGVGVFDSLKLIGKIVIDGLNKKYSRLSRPPSAASPPAGGPSGIPRPAAPKRGPVVQPATPLHILNPVSEKVYYTRGIAYSKIGRYKEAAEAFKQAIRIKPDCAEAHFNRGLSYFMLDEFQEAIEHFKVAIWYLSNDAVTHHALGLAYLEVGEKKPAFDEYKILKKLDSDRADMLLNRMIDKK